MGSRARLGRPIGPVLDLLTENLLADRPDLTTEQLDRTRRLMTAALPDANVTGHERLIEEQSLPDPDDRHVLAAALKAAATFLVTDNVRDFPAEEMRGSLRVVSPDEFVVLLAGDDLDTVVEVIDAQAVALVNPPMTVSQLLDGLEEVGMVESVAQLRAAIS